MTKRFRIEAISVKRSSTTDGHGLTLMGTGFSTEEREGHEGVGGATESDFTGGNGGSRGGTDPEFSTAEDTEERPEPGVSTEEREGHEGGGSTAESNFTGNGEADSASRTAGAASGAVQDPRRRRREVKVRGAVARE